MSGWSRLSSRVAVIKARMASDTIPFPLSVRQQRVQLGPGVLDDGAGGGHSEDAYDLGKGQVGPTAAGTKDAQRRCRHCPSLDMTLDEIRLLLRFKDAPQAECGQVNTLLDEHIGHVASRIRELRQLEKQLKALREQCVSVRAAAHCGILNELTQLASSTGPRSASEHVPGSHASGGRHSHVLPLE